MMKQSALDLQVILLFLLALFALGLGMGKAPLFLEEPRRALVAMEMLYSGDFIHTTIHGAPYYNKPPLFNWVIAAGFKVFGYQEWVLRAITVFSHLLTGWLVYLAGRKYFSQREGLLAAALYLAGADILYYFSLLGEIDVFFSMLVVAGWLGYFHFGRQDKWLAAFAILYFFMALAFLTKGLPAILFLGFSLVTWHWFTRTLKRLFSWQHIAGFLLFGLLVGSYLYPFLEKGDLDTLIETFWSQSLERTTAESNLWKRVGSLVMFPVSLAKDMMPGMLLVFTFSFTIFRKEFRSNALVAFCSLIFLANIWVYWISPGSRSRYMYMFHPLVLLVLVHMYTTARRQGLFTSIVETVFKVIPYLVLVLLLAACALLPVFLSGGYVIITAVALVLGMILFFVAKRQEWEFIYLAVLFMLLLRLPYGWIVGNERATTSNAAKDKAVASEMAANIKEADISLLDSTRISTTISYYLQRDLGRIVPFSNSPESGSYVILPDSLLRQDMTVMNRFLYQGKAFSMVRIP